MRSIRTIEPLRRQASAAEPFSASSRKGERAPPAGLRTNAPAERIRMMRCTNRGYATARARDCRARAACRVGSRAATVLIHGLWRRRAPGRAGGASAALRRFELRSGEGPRRPAGTAAGGWCGRRARGAVAPGVQDFDRRGGWAVDWLRTALDHRPAVREPLQWRAPPRELWPRTVRALAVALVVRVRTDATRIRRST